MVSQTWDWEVVYPQLVGPAEDVGWELSYLVGFSKSSGQSSKELFLVTGGA